VERHRENESVRSIGGIVAGEKTGELPPDTTFSQVQLKIRESYRNPNVGEG
jgi:hypothetical protein